MKGNKEIDRGEIYIISGRGRKDVKHRIID
jgi:hypothetical protein